ncbi:MAG: hydroxyethylthiazole kinase [Endomicrobium sp.]|jgi:hydroxyethylthiazole kinase|nr:hydroxyethylthiazole kinase [Endomicrobium sp.]
MKEVFEIVKAVEEVRSQNPLVVSWTNFVTINFVANAQLAVGGRAAMCFLPDEANPITYLAKAVYINMGTLQPIAAESIPQAAKSAVEFNKPWTLDPVAAGLGDTRNCIIKELKRCPPNIIRGNASEVIALANLWNLQTSQKGKVEGVDSTNTVDEAFQSAAELVKFTGGAVAVSGETDLILGNKKAYHITGGSKMLKSITGAGCSLGGVIAVFSAVTDSLTAALTGSLVYKWASQKAQKSAAGTASFQNDFIDNLSLISVDELSEYAQKHLREVNIQ